MIETPEIRDALELLSPPMRVEHDWNDVLRRARRTSRSPLRRRGLVLVAIATAVVPAIAAASIHYALRSPAKLVVGTRITDSQLGLEASFTASPRASFTHVSSGRLGVTRDIDWTLTLATRAKAVVNAALVLPTGRIVLCESCRAREHRSATGRGGIWLQILDGRGRLVLTANGRALTANVRREKR